MCARSERAPGRAEPRARAPRRASRRPRPSKAPSGHSVWSVLPDPPRGPRVRISSALRLRDLALRRRARVLAGAARSGRSAVAALASCGPRRLVVIARCALCGPVSGCQIVQPALYSATGTNQGPPSYQVSQHRKTSQITFASCFLLHRNLVMTGLKLGSEHLQLAKPNTLD